MSGAEIIYARADLATVPLLRDLLQEADAVFADPPLDAQLRALVRDPEAPRMPPPAVSGGMAARLYERWSPLLDDEAAALRGAGASVRVLPEAPPAGGPLDGMRVLVTRPADQAAHVAARLRLAGATVLLAPAISIGPPSDRHALASAAREAASYEMIAFTSRNGVQAFCAALAAQEQDVRQLAGVHLFAVGAATAKSLEVFGLLAERLPARQSATGLAMHLRNHAKPGERVLLIGPEPPDATLLACLREGGLQVTALGAYRTHVGMETLPVQTPDAALFYSPSAVQGAFAAMGASALRNMTIVAVGQTTATACLAQGVAVAAIAAAPSDEAVVEALCECLMQRKREEERP